MNEPGHGTSSTLREFGFTWIDYVLMYITAPITIWVIMSATSGLVNVLVNTRKRRIFFAIALAAEAALVVMFVWLVVAF